MRRRSEKGETVAASVLYFSYVGKVHRLRVPIADCLLTSSPSNARSVWAADLEWTGGLAPDKRWGWVFRLGDIALVLGVLCMGLTLWILLARAR